MKPHGVTTASKPNFYFIYIYDIIWYIYIYIEREREREIERERDWVQVTPDTPLDYIIFIYSPHLQNFKVIKDW